MDEETYNNIVNKAYDYVRSIQEDDDSDYLEKQSTHHTYLIISIIVFTGCCIGTFRLFKLQRIGVAFLLITIGLIFLLCIICNSPKEPTTNYHVLVLNKIKQECIIIFAKDLGISVYEITDTLKNYISRNKKELEVEEDATYTQYYNFATRRINTKKESFKIENFWLDKKKVDWIYNKLCTKYKKSMVKEDLTIDKLRLQNENLKLQNKELEIKIDLAKPWTCQYCGNMNRGDDMSCIKCGGSRS